MNSPLLLTLALVLFYVGVTVVFLEEQREEEVLAPVPAETPQMAQR